MRLTRRFLSTFVLWRMTPKTDSTGGKYLIFDPAVYPETSFKGVLLHPKRSMERSETGVRLALTWRVLVPGAPPVHPGDQVHLLGDLSRIYTVSNVKPFPLHLEIEMEVVL